jgi:hypothetical protein
MTVRPNPPPQPPAAAMLMHFCRELPGLLTKLINPNMHMLAMLA